MSILISVVICTYNRAELLNIVLQTLCSQTLDPSHYEVIVVDNNSKDDTKNVAMRICSKYANFYYYYEPNQGASHARNRGWKEANGAYIAFVDDECKIPKRWLEVAEKIIHQHNPGVFGGPILGYFKGPKPKWYKYFSHEPLTKAKFLNTKDYTLIIGGNLFVKKNLLIKVGGFDPSLGPRGNKMRYGEETVMLDKIVKNEKTKIYFDPDLYLYHFFLAKKTKWPFIIKASFFVGVSMFQRRKDYFYAQANYSFFLKEFVKICLGLVIDIFRSVLIRDKIKYPYVQNYLYENSLNYVRQLGRLYGQFQKADWGKEKAAHDSG